jgi:hypothetical protein
VNLQEAKSQIADAIDHASTNTPQVVERLCLSVISDLPRNGGTLAELVWAYEHLIYLRREEGRVMRAMRVFRQYLGDCAPACDPAYDQFYHDGLLATGTSPVPLRRRERYYSLVRLFRETLPLQGLVAECGCFRGLSSYLLCRLLKLADAGFDGRGYRIFDSFQGLSVPQPEDTIADSDPEAERLQSDSQPGRFAASLETVKASLSGFPNVEFFPGWIPEAFPSESETRYRFVHVDVDVYQPTRDSISYFYPRLVPGGMIVCDDYIWPGARKAIGDFCAHTGIKFTITPNQQACIVRSA